MTDPGGGYDSGMLIRPVRPETGFTGGGVSRWMRRRQLVVGVVGVVVVGACVVGFAVFIAGFVVGGGVALVNAIDTVE